ncbi:family 20 glycosylhydrolase [Amycolatopsis thermalba]|uniref:beta-N-acetylhexosaminidase n=2 Tax=Amycolatopsis thermalba TaxID=944492 RepID=A0ABY4P663_9PSEU|nr:MULTISPECIES: glycoside hydrolase family 20 zincin-like fold domain-containing protein [Amycolatopsis]UQS27764.1 family 20 glycosylhydrolase [Amycolatopsis thermalba]
MPGQIDVAAGPVPELIPRPRKLTAANGRPTFPCSAFGGLEIPVALAPWAEHVQGVLGTTEVADGFPPRISFEPAALPAENYRLAIRADSVRVEFADPRGALHAVRTLLDLWDGYQRTALPVLDIEDGPDLPTRGVFIESFTGTDRMDLPDWRDLIDRLAQLKLNTIGLSIYGCWDIRHGQRPAEYMFTPLTGFPELASSTRITTWDAEKGAEVELEYVPVIFEKDLFSEICAYAAERGVELIPHLGGPGHSTLIPRVVRVLSAVDSDGTPTGYGYCVSRPEARNALARLVRNLVDQHLRPNGLRRLHVAGDEYYPIRNVDPRDRQRLVSPYCACEGCRDLSPGHLLIEYLMLVGTVLADDGIEMVHWQDTLVREGVLDEYLDRVAERGLPEPVIVWWKYNDPVPEPRAERTETWVAPTTGLFPHLFGQDFTENISTAIRKGALAGATGVLAYWIPDPADHQNVACLADLAWNSSGSAGAAGFRPRWARYVSPCSSAEAEQAFSLAGTITASYPSMMYVVDQVLPYFADSGVPGSRYPDDQLRAFSVTQPPLAEALRQIAATLREAITLMPSGREVRFWPNPVQQWRDETHRTAASLELFLDVLALTYHHGDDREETAEVTRKAHALLRHVSRSKPAYLAPAALREHWLFVKEIGPSVRRLREAPGVGPRGSWHPWIV